MTGPTGSGPDDEPLFRLQRCRSCGAHQHYERPSCASCGAVDLHLVPASGRGVVHAFTVVHRSLTERWPAPYVVALVRLEEGPVVMSHVVDSDPDQLACEVPVSGVWARFDDGTRLPVFRRVAAASS